MTSQFLFMASPTKFYHVTQIILQIWLCDQSLVTLAFLGEVIITPISEGFDQKNHFFFEESSWFKFNNLELVLGMVL